MTKKGKKTEEPVQTETETQTEIQSEVVVIVETEVTETPIEEPVKKEQVEPVKKEHRKDNRPIISDCSGKTIISDCSDSLILFWSSKDVLCNRILSIFWSVFFFFFKINEKIIIKMRINKITNK